MSAVLISGTLVLGGVPFFYAALNPDALWKIASGAAILSIATVQKPITGYVAIRGG